ncbi:MAG: phosphoglycerate dehydrogenase, partial [Meiothermus ruber]|nr:phosphoglycerate dehydrogenase [Meiothermus ruber]
MWKVLVTDEMRLGEVKHPQVRLDYKPGMAREELLQVIGAYDALITRSRTQVDARVLEAGVNLKV